MNASEGTLQANPSNGFLARHAGKIKLAAVAVLVGALFMLMRALPIDVLQGALERWVENLGVWGPIVYGLVYIVATVLLIPASLLTLAAGAIFGLGLGLVVVSIASTTGAGCAFLIARYLARSRVEAMAASNDKFGAIDAAISEGGWRIVAMLRLSPAVPFGLQNYLYGLTSIRFVPYVLTSWIAMLPGTFLYVYLGLAAKSAAGADGGRSAGEWALLVVGLLATLGVSVYITRLARAKLAERTQLAGEESSADEAESRSASGRMPWKLLTAAAVAVVLAVVAQAQSVEIAEAVGRWVGG